MSTFSVNQSNQLYVVTAYGSALPTSASAIGTGFFKKGADGKLRLGYKGPGGVVSSPSFSIEELIAAGAKKASELVRPLNKYKVALSANPIAGQDYILRIAFRNFIGLSEEDQYAKFGEVRATTGMTAEQFYNAMASSLTKNFSKEVSALLGFSTETVAASVVMTTNTGVTVTAKAGGTSGNSLKFAVASVSADTEGIVVSTAAGVTTITASLTAAAKTIGALKALLAADEANAIEANELITITGTNATTVLVEATPVALVGGATTGIIVSELEQDWILGKYPQTPVYFEVFPEDITVSAGVIEKWGVVTAVSSTTSVKNGKLVADMEYFYMGNRGDFYRGMGFPHTIHTEYLVDPSKEYHIINIAYKVQGNANEDVQNQRQEITLVVPQGSTGSELTAVNAVIGGLNTAAGSTVIATLS